MTLDNIETWRLIGRQLRYSALSRNPSSIKQARSRSASKIEVEGGGGSKNSGQSATLIRLKALLWRARLGIEQWAKKSGLWSWKEVRSCGPVELWSCGAANH